MDLCLRTGSHITRKCAPEISTINKLDESINGEITKAFSDADITLTDAEFLENFLHKLTGSVTATRNYIVPETATIETTDDLTVRKVFKVHVSTTGGDILVKTSSGNGVTLRAGDKATLYVDGTDVVRLGEPTANTLADQQTHPQCPVYHRIDVLQWARAQRDEPDPFTEEERDKILDWYGRRKPQYYPFVFV